MNPQITGKTKLFGLLGWPVSHSKSPQMHTAAARAAGLDLVYLSLPVHPAAVGEAVRGLPALGIMGVNVTVPHKQAVIPFLDELDPAARALGAVNTILIQQAGPDYAPMMKGFNTDAPGFTADLAEHEVKLDGRHAILLGAGGSARAVAYALAQQGGVVHVLARRPEQAEGLIQALSGHVPPHALFPHPLDAAGELADRFSDALIVNSTPLGMAPGVERSVWQDEWLFPARGFVYDLVYTPADTRLMQQARAAGVPTANGLGMLVHQGAEAFYLWTGVRPDLSVMRSVLK